MIHTLLITLAIEALVDSLYCHTQRKPQASVLVTGLCVNVLTQMGLWMVLTLFPRPYFPVLLCAEILVFAAEGAWLAAFPSNRLTLGEAWRLSLLRNLVSFAVGLLLPL